MSAIAKMPVKARAASLKTVADLEAARLVPANSGLEAVAEKYAIGITPAVLELIDSNDPADPMALQFVPSGAELLTTPEEREDPIGDLSHSPVEGIVHRYPDRVLLKAVHVCPVYCRFCFRREMVGPQGLGLMERLREIEHVKIVRFHTRVPVVEPERIDAEMVAALTSSGKTTYLAVHANHPREFSAAAKAAFKALVDGGVVLVSQSVLLRGINDDVETLAALMRGFVENRVKPYYLHHPDLAPGTGHFRLSIEEGQKLVAALRGRISGLCQPTYVLDIPGGHGKADIGAATVAGRDGCFTVRDWQGEEHAYPPS